MTKIAVIGAGNAGLAMAAHLKKVGGTVALYDIVEAQLTPIIENDRIITAKGHDFTGEYQIDVAAAMGLQLPTVLDWLKRSYGVVGQNLYQALQTAKNYQGIAAPLLQTLDDKRNLRYVIEDVPTGLVPVSALGRKFGVATPAIDTIINLANIIFDTDFRASGRNLDQLGLTALTPEEIINL